MPNIIRDGLGKTKIIFGENVESPNIINEIWHQPSIDLLSHHIKMFVNTSLQTCPLIFCSTCKPPSSGVACSLTLCLSYQRLIEVHHLLLKWLIVKYDTNMMPITITTNNLHITENSLTAMITLFFMKRKVLYIDYPHLDYRLFDTIII